MEDKFVLIGDQFPKMTVETTDGTKTLPDDHSGKWFILFSHPADFTPVCTTEFVAFQRRFKQFKELGVDLIGLSTDQVFSHIKWLDWIEDTLGEEIEFPVIADHNGAVAKKLGLIHPGKGSTTVRAVYIVDPNSIVRAILYYPQELGRNMDEIVRMVKGLQFADNNKVAIPAGWPNNELIKDEVIIPPAKDRKTAKQRMKQHQCFDWWFCHKKM